MKIGPDFFRLVGLALLVIVCPAVISWLRSRAESPWSRRQRVKRAIARAERGLAHKQQQLDRLRHGLPHA